MNARQSDCRPRVVTIPSGDTHKFAMSALCQKQTHALQQKRLLNDLIGDLLQMHWHVEA